MQHLSSKSDNFQVYDLGYVSYDEARRISREVFHPKIGLSLVEDKFKSEGVLLFAKHPPTLTLGKRIKKSDLSIDVIKFWESRGVVIIETDRGGKISYHGPGQLMIYPLISLPSHGLSVKQFVESALGAVASILKSLGGLDDLGKPLIDAFVDKEVQGVWIHHEGMCKKIASAGFRILKGKSEHGIALYINKIPQEFSYFNPCGLCPEVFTSLEEVSNRDWSVEFIKESFARLFPSFFSIENEMLMNNAG